jgi:hypothetical protein
MVRGDTPSRRAAPRSSTARGDVGCDPDEAGVATALWGIGVSIQTAPIGHRIALLSDGVKRRIARRHRAIVRFRVKSKLSENVRKCPTHRLLAMSDFVTVNDGPPSPFYEPRPLRQAQLAPGASDRLQPGVF